MWNWWSLVKYHFQMLKVKIYLCTFYKIVPFLLVTSFQTPYEKIFAFRSINLPSHRHREDPSNSNRVEHLQPEVMSFESEVAESVNDVQVSHFQRHQQTVEAQMGRMLQGTKLLLLLCLSTNCIPSHYYVATSYTCIAATGTVS
jgi:hypothetical protein